MPNRTLEEFERDQEKLNDDLARVEHVALHFEHAVESRPTKKTVFILFAMLAILFVLSTAVDAWAGWQANDLANQNNAILVTLDPESDEYAERRENLIEVIIEANDKSNLENYCEVERGLLLRFTDEGEELPPPTPRCEEYIERVYGE
jgi:hypothetical protein